MIASAMRLGNELLRAKADALRELALRLTTIKATSFFYRGQDPEQFTNQVRARANILRDRVIEATMADGSVRRLREPISAMDTEKTSPKQKPDSKPISPNAKPAGNAPEESFGELLKLDPKRLKSIKVLKKKP